MPDENSKQEDSGSFYNSAGKGGRNETNACTIHSPEAKQVFPSPKNWKGREEQKSFHQLHHRSPAFVLMGDSMSSPTQKQIQIDVRQDRTPPPPSPNQTPG